MARRKRPTSKSKPQIHSPILTEQDDGSSAASQPYTRRNRNDDGQQAANRQLAEDLPGGIQNERSPSAFTVWGFSAAIILHLGALLVALSSNFTQSYVQGELLGWLSPYLVSTNQMYGSTPLELTHAEPFDFPMHFEVNFSNEPGWQRLDFTDIRQPSSYSPRWQNLSRVARIIIEDDSEGEILAELSLALLKAGFPEQANQATSIRFVQPHVYSFDEDLIASGDERELLSDEFAPDIVYSADVVSTGEQVIGVVPVIEAYRVSSTSSEPPTQAKDSSQ